MTLDFPLDRPSILFNIEHFLVSLKTYRTNAKKKKTLNIPENLENTAVSQDWKRSVFISIP